MMIEIKNCILTDANDILLLYEAARKLQTERKMVVWPIFNKSFIENEIAENRQWKILYDEAIACNWAIAFEDKQIWGEKNKTIQYTFIVFVQTQTCGGTGILIKL